MLRLRHYSIEVQGLQKCPNNHNMSHFQLKNKLLLFMLLSTASVIECH
uniref:Uncharacterized protein n=1 Tax=Setaria viridis TaxID=4556 RepID=A0A4U6SXH5_SETVI|nr:hypothetical protein SEVIR_9G209950v2 [Setaria viridis]